MPETKNFVVPGQTVPSVDGTQTMAIPESVVAVTGEDTTPPIPPEPDFPDELPTEIPFGDVEALQEMQLLPRMRWLDKTRGVDTDIRWDGAGGERNEIGYMQEDHAAFLAGNHDELLPGILEVAKQQCPTRAEGMDFAHHPNLYWLPWLMTGDPIYAQNLERVHNLFMKWRKRIPGEQDFGSKVFGRELAWNMRDLSQLVLMQRMNHTVENTYEDTMARNFARYGKIAAGVSGRPETHEFNVLGFGNVNYTTYGQKGWMDAYQGIVFGRMVRFGYSDWKEIALYIYQNLENRIAHWNWKGVDFDFMGFYDHAPSGEVDSWPSCYEFAGQQTWDTMGPFVGNRRVKYEAMPDDWLIPVVIDGTRMTYYNRGQDIYQWARWMVGIDPRAEETASTMYQKLIDRDGDDITRWNYRHAAAEVPNWEQAYARSIHTKTGWRPQEYGVDDS